MVNDRHRDAMQTVEVVKRLETASCETPAASTDLLDNLVNSQPLCCILLLLKVLNDKCNAENY